MLFGFPTDEIIGPRLVWKILRGTFPSREKLSCLSSVLIWSLQRTCESFQTLFCIFVPCLRPRNYFVFVFSVAQTPKVPTWKKILHSVVPTPLSFWIWSTCFILQLEKQKLTNFFSSHFSHKNFQ